MANLLKRIIALRVLKSRLIKNGFELYPPGDMEVGFGAEVCVILDGPTNWGIKKSVDHVMRINNEVADKFQLVAVGRGPIWSENAIAVAYCGFKR